MDWANASATSRKRVVANLDEVELVETWAYAQPQSEDENNFHANANVYVTPAV